ncbi:glycosyltransferase [Anaeroarcus burkinensis]|uniref:glycosyltransferase n=1 Tax=Anaeroarcus burkinensis TaxID=82376 RepID=UPI0006888EFB|nr:glycosyltransferase [Anaeroarcus burkinensis]
MERSYGPWSTLTGIWQLYLFFRREKFDMIQYATPKAALISSIAGALARVPVRLYCQWGIRYVGFSGWRRILFKIIEKLVCILSTHISPDSNGNRQFSIEEGLYTAEKSSVVHKGSANGVSLERFFLGNKSVWRAEIRRELGWDSSMTVFGWVGRVTRDKGVGELLRAFLVLSEQRPDIRLLMIGGWEEHPCLSEAVLATVKNHPQIAYVGSKSDVERYYATMDVLVAPSYREGFGSVALEAQAMEVPVVLSDIPGPREAMIPGETGILVPAKDSETLAAAMLFLYNEKERRLQMGKAGRRFVEENFEQSFFWEKVLEHRQNLLAKAGIYGVKHETSN